MSSSRRCPAPSRTYRLTSRMPRCATSSRGRYAVESVTTATPDTDRTLGESARRLEDARERQRLSRRRDRRAGARRCRSGHPQRDQPRQPDPAQPRLVRGRRDPRLHRRRRDRPLPGPPQGRLPPGRGRRRLSAMASARPHYGPPDPSRAPRYTGIRTFARCPASTDWENADVAVLGVPFDTATSMRPGPRFGPAAIRDQSLLIRPWHTAHAVDVFATPSVVDGGDIEVTPGNAERKAAQIAAGLQPVVDAGTVPLVLGGDHSIVLGELRAHARRHGPAGVVLLDAHADTWDQYYGEKYFHGTPFRRALEEGLINPTRSFLAGMRGPLYAASDLGDAREMGFEIVSTDELRALTPEEYGRRVRERVGDGPVYFSFDIDVLDPSVAPATGTPEVAGLLPHEALAFIRSLAGIRFSGFDVVEVSPPYDNAGQVTALLAANIAYEFIALTAVAA